MPDTRPLAISAPAPRTLDLIFTPEALKELHQRYRIVEADPDDIAGVGDAVLAEARYIIGQPPLDHATLQRMGQLRAILNVESNLINNMPYEVLFERGIHVVTTGQVFAEPVAELGLAMALNIARGVVDADLAFREGHELWGGDGNRSARLLSGSDIGIIGFGDLGKALNRVLSGFRARIRVFDPWMPASILRDNGVEPASLDTVLGDSNFVFVVAAVTSENEGFLGEKGLCPHAPWRRLHPPEPGRRRRFRCTDGSRRTRPYRGGQRRLSARAAAARPPGSPPAGLSAFGPSRRRARQRLQEDGRDGARGHGSDGPQPAADALQAGRAKTVARMRSKPVTVN